MKKISEYINGMEPGEIVPSIKGIITKVVPAPAGKEIQYITIASEDKIENIKLAINKNKWVPDPYVGNVLSLVSTAKKKESAKGLTLKSGKNGLYISVGEGASIEEEPVTELEPEPEPMTAADSAIDNYVLDRLYIFSRAMKILERFNESSEWQFNVEKVPELATAVHIELAKRGMVPRPDDNQTERKKVHKDKKEGKLQEEFSKSDWRDFKNPVSGVSLGSEGVSKIAEVYVPWVLRISDPSSLENGPKELYRVVNLAAQELGITPSKSFDALLVKYINDYEPNSEKRRKTLIAKFAKGLEEEKLVADSVDITDKEATYLIKNFRKVWDSIMESDEDDE